MHDLALAAAVVDDVHVLELKVVADERVLVVVAAVVDILVEEPKIILKI